MLLNMSVVPLLIVTLGCAVVQGALILKRDAVALASTAATAEDISQILSIHNKYRASIRAANMNKLVRQLHCTIL